ncbi:glycerol-3-phosphate 1-O-acyltransferase PlsY [Aliikangiella marina]|uniref:glycerol-3-phosphate 1-O-acyltransferase PlsY n=1 Tax=Aliikangiella marina TaxID=1712262 RepID=UPI00163D6634|nr:glycerol-3-phosphate 1-O-acyltransferase PlsY [Aliikangiella marina]
MDIQYASLLLLAYLSGSISSAILICQLMTLPDPRIVGSGNPGATNVHRIGGKLAALATLIGDLLKTAVPIAVAIYLDYPPFWVAWVGVCALLGHCFPIYYRFKGGKGVASMFAVLVLVGPKLSPLAIGSWIILAWSFKRSSVASIITAVVVPSFAYQFANELFIPLSALSAIVVLRHRKNFANIIAGKEPIIGVKAGPKSPENH